MDNIFAPLAQLSSFNHIKDALSRHISPVAVFGLADSQRSHFLSALIGGRNLLFITSNDLKCRRLADELETLTGRPAAVFSADNSILFNRRMTGSDELALRLSVLNRLRTDSVDIVVASIDALLRPLTAPDLFDQGIRSLSVGSALDEAELISYLIKVGYERAGTAENPGQFSVRGGIIDVISPGSDTGLRIELFGDEIDSLRSFSPETQRSLHMLSTALLTPARETLIRDAQACSQKLKAAAAQFFKAYKGENKDEKQRFFAEAADALARGEVFAAEQAFLPFMIDRPAYLTDYFKEPPMIVLDEPKAIAEHAGNLFSDFAEILKSMLEHGEALPDYAENLSELSAFYSHIKAADTLIFQSFSGSIPYFAPEAVYTIAARAMQSFYGNVSLFVDEIKQLLELPNAKIAVQSESLSKARRMLETLRENDITAALISEPDFSWQSCPIGVTAGSLERGFSYTTINFSVITEQDIFVKQLNKRARKRAVNARPIKAFSELSVGDFVVHEASGIGIFRGVEQLDISGTVKDYIKIDYSGTDKLYIPAEQMDSIQKYIGMDEASPKLSKLGSAEWNNTKARVKKSIEDMTEQLSALYAARSVVKGYAFSPDTPWQRQFEDDFAYTETSDQLMSIAEIKKDMESDKVMDRLLCGDVGYGKTEVAIRAAFKAVMDGKQAAILAPTTILARQHYITLMERLQDYPVKCDVISRFRTPKEQKSILERLSAGNIDIIVGTHSLLGKNVVFKDLGLLIIDEEQRFGVKHKEKIKELKKNIDVLTMTATPIPRTLHMSLTGIRDMSLIENPPEDRYPVQTYVLDYADSLVRDAVLRELHRGGQVFIVVNRVLNIEAYYRRFTALVPEASICVAHGQMPASELENTMMDFYNGVYNVLLCTTIIENGIDIPLANTLIICDADKFGLSQLYQMRGRVGRSNRIAYAYFTVQPNNALSETAQKRLNAIRDFTDLGSGFKIAMRDLEIRGAGNILGSAQHGHMSAVGYEMYSKMIEEAVRKIKGEETETLIIQPIIDIRLDAFIPNDYIPGELKRIEVYKTIAAVNTRDRLTDTVDELLDRFGTIPDSVMNLVNIAYLKNLAARTGLSSLSQKGRNLVCTFHPAAVPDMARFTAALSGFSDKCLFGASVPPTLTFLGKSAPVIPTAIAFMEQYLA